MPSYYSKYLGPKLSERVREALNTPHDEQVSLYEELALTRTMACEALKLAQPLFDDKQCKKLNEETKALMVTTLGTAMNNVKDLVLAASRIEKDASDKVSIKVINLIVRQIIMAINDVCGTERMELAEAIAHAIDQRVRLPLNDRVSPEVKIDLLEAEIVDT